MWSSCLKLCMLMNILMLCNVGKQGFCSFFSVWGYRFFLKSATVVLTVAFQYGLHSSDGGGGWTIWKSLCVHCWEKNPFCEELQDRDKVLALHSHLWVVHPSHLYFSDLSPWIQVNTQTITNPSVKFTACHKYYY